MDQWTFELAGGDRPLFLRLADAVTRDIRRGRLAPGDRLPGSRRVADQLGLHRNTVLAAWRELEREGWIETEAARGTFVARTLPELEVATRSRSSREAGFDVEAVATDWSPRPKGALPLLGGLPDLRHLPRTAIARAYRRALRRKGILDYGDPAGDPGLRRALAGRLAAARGLAVEPDAILVTRGSQMAFDLVARAMLRPGDRVAVEALGYRPAWRALGSSGAELVPIRVDEQGIDVDRLEAALAEGPLRAIYLTPHHQYPTTATLSPARRMRLLRLAARHRVAVIEDDYDHEFHYEGRPVLPLGARDDHGVVIHVGTLSKVLAPAFRIGWVVAPSPLHDALVGARTFIDRMGDPAVEHAVGELIEEGELHRHTLRARRRYRRRRDAMVELLTEAFGDRLRFRVPRGGMALWARAPGVDVDEWARRAEDMGVIVQSSRLFTFRGRPRRAVRLGYAALEPDELREAVRRLRRAWPGA